MTRLEETRTVPTSPEATFAYTADFANLADWDPGAVASSRRTEGGLGVGTQFDVLVGFGSAELPMVYTITAFDPPHRVVLSGVGKRLGAVDDIRFRATDAGTEIHYVADLEFKGLMKLAEPFLQRRIVEAGRQALDGLATKLAS